ncbi:MAG: hypothetical protein ABIW49_07385 [Knoellia sp.]
MKQDAEQRADGDGAAGAEQGERFSTELPMTRVLTAQPVAHRAGMARAQAQRAWACLGSTAA